MQWDTSIENIKCYQTIWKLLAWYEAIIFLTVTDDIHNRYLMFSSNAHYKQFCKKMLYNSLPVLTLKHVCHYSVPGSIG
jgi:hypothetical protein